MSDKKKSEEKPRKKIEVIEGFEPERSPRLPPPKKPPKKKRD